MSKFIRSAMTVICLFLSFVVASTPESISATHYSSGIIGRITTEDGAVVPGANIRIIDKSTKKLFETKSNGEGEYSVELNPSPYEVQVQARGFKTAKRKNIKVHPNAKSIVDFVLKYGREEIVDGKHP